MSHTQIWNKWIKLLPEEDIPSVQRDNENIGYGYCTHWPILTIQTDRLLVTFGDTPCFSHSVLAYMNIPTLIENPKGWKSEYRGDEAPTTKGNYLVTIEVVQQGRKRFLLDHAYHDGKEWAQWNGVDPTSIMGFRPYPKPYKATT